MKSFALIFLVSTTLAGLSNGFSSSSGAPRISTTSLEMSSTAQASYGQETPLPDTYAQCGRCQSAYAVTEADFGEGSRGRRLECSVCGHSWFQSKDRIMKLGDGFEMTPLPDEDLTRIQTNIKEGKSPRFTGDSKLYVGNISFGSTEEDIRSMFSEIAEVGEVILVRDDMGRNRGFGFVTMRTKEGGQKCIDVLDGKDLDGRSLAVRESNN